MKDKISIDICLSDIPKECITEGKNGKKYIKLVMVERKEAGNYGETHFVAISQTKEQREAKMPTVYIGNAKPIIYQPKVEEKPTETPFSVPDKTNDLPF
jgi:hypothetical protein